MRGGHLPPDGIHDPPDGEPAVPDARRPRLAGAGKESRRHFALSDDLLAERREIDPAHPYEAQAEAGLRVYADESLLRQLLLILLDNAACYTPTGGAILVSVASDENGACLSVRDEGCGVPADQLENIFERFYRVDKARDRATGGTGLGLSIARTIVRMHGGDIRAQLPNGPACS